MLTADHGGRRASSHCDRALLANYRIPFVVWGRGVGPGDLYGLNPGLRRPRHARSVGYGARQQPVRNGDLANLALDLLGLGPVPGQPASTSTAAARRS